MLFYIMLAYLILFTALFNAVSCIMLVYFLFPLLFMQMIFVFILFVFALLTHSLFISFIISHHVQCF